MTLLENDTVQTERRATPREPIRSLIYVSLEANNGGILLDLGLKGMQVSVARPLHTGTNVHLSFGSNSSQRIEGIGNVAWIARSGKSAGISFRYMSRESFARIEELLKSESLNPVSDYFPSEHASTPVSKADVDLPGPVHSPQSEGRPPASESLASVPHSASDGSAGSTRPIGTRLTANSTELLTLSDGNSHRDIPATAGNDILPDFSPSSFEVHHYSPGQETHDSDATIVPGHADNKPPLESDPILADTTPEFVATQSDLPLNQVAEQSQHPTVNSHTFQPQSGTNDPLKPFTLTPTYDCPPSSWALGGKAIVSAFITIGGELESDWHAITGLLLLAAGFLALSQHPPLIVLAVALWIAAAAVLTGKKGVTRKTDP